MTTRNQKLEILRCLNNLDTAQTEKVLNYIRGLQDVEDVDDRQKHLKRRALQEIGQAFTQSLSF